MDTSTLTVVCAFAGFVISIFYLNTKSDDRWAALKNETESRSQKSDDRWATLKTESDDRWAALKTESDDRWAKLLEAFTDFKDVTTAKWNRPEKK